MKSVVKIRFGVIGTNFISDLMVNGGKQDPRFEAAAVYSRHEDTGRAFAEKHDIPKVYTSMAVMLADSSLDAIYVASPNAFHCEQTIQCLRAGKHVLCEKPMAGTAAEARLMVEEARKNNVLLMEAMIPTLSPAFKTIVKNLPRIGTIRRYFASYCQYSSRYDNLKRGIVANAFKPELSNGAIMDIGVYCLYPMVALFGKPNKITASCVKLPTGVDGQGTITASYDGFDGVCIYSKIADSLLPSEIQGESGTITIGRINEPHRVTFKQHDKSLPVEVLYDDTNANPYYHEINHFINLIEAGVTESSLNTFATSVNTLIVTDEVRRQCDLPFPADKLF